MTILPIKLISEVDQPIFGANLLNLAKLERLGFLVVPGVGVSPPEIVLNIILKHLEGAGREIFEGKVSLAKSELAKIPLPEQLQKEVKSFKSFYLNGEIIRKKELLWRRLMEVWLREIGNKIWNNSLGVGVASRLSSQAVFNVHGSFTHVSAHYDPQLKDVVIKCKQKLLPPILKKIDDLVASANKKLFLPQIYEFLMIGEKVFLVKVTPFTQTLHVSKTEDVVVSKKDERALQKTAVKIFLNLSEGYTVASNLDGILIEGERISGFDNLTFQIGESALSFPGKPVIYKLPDIYDQEKIRGALRLINQTSILKESAKTFLYIRNKKSLHNLELGLPVARSCQELLQLKRELAVLGINRKGTLRFWQVMSVPENFINLGDYLAVGIDGVILDLDELQKNLGGYDVAEGEFYKGQVRALVSFLKLPLKSLHSAKIPVLAKGELTLHHDILDFLVEAGVWGVVINNPLQVESIPEHLSFVERRMVLKRLGL